VIIGHGICRKGCSYVLRRREISRIGRVGRVVHGLGVGILSLAIVRWLAAVICLHVRVCEFACAQRGQDNRDKAEEGPVRNLAISPWLE